MPRKKKVGDGEVVNFPAADQSGILSVGTSSDDILKAISSLKSDIVSELDKVNKRVDDIVQPKVNDSEPKMTRTLETKTTETTTLEINGVEVKDDYPIPQEYQQAVNSILNKDFGVRILPIKDAPAFQFIVLVPKKYSNVSPAHLQMYKYDMRPKVITYTEGTNGVKEWCEAVYKNLGAETQAMITTDRNKHE